MDGNASGPGKQRDARHPSSSEEKLAKGCRPVSCFKRRRFSLESNSNAPMAIRAQGCSTRAKGRSPLDGTEATAQIQQAAPPAIGHGPLRSLGQSQTPNEGSAAPKVRSASDKAAVGSDPAGQAEDQYHRLENVTWA